MIVFSQHRDRDSSGPCVHTNGPLYGVGYGCQADNVLFESDSPYSRVGAVAEWWEMHPQSQLDSRVAVLWARCGTQQQALTPGYIFHLSTRALVYLYVHPSGPPFFSFTHHSDGFRRS
jgi:hypothetical protein